MKFYNVLFFIFVFICSLSQISHELELSGQLNTSIQTGTSSLSPRSRRRGGDENTEAPTRPNEFNYTPRASACFDNHTETEVTVQMGKTAYLRCRVLDLAERTVSWVRQKDYHILTVGMFTYTTVERFSVRHKKESEDWTLQISSTKPQDSGIYECQVNSNPKISKEIRLNVIAVSAVIDGAPEIYIKSGSTLNLKCLIMTSGRPPEHVFWYHNNKVIEYDKHEFSADLANETTPNSQSSDSLKNSNSISTTISRHTIINASPKDSGNYTCKPSFIDPTSVHVHVLSGEKSSAAKQYETQSSPALHYTCHHHLLLIAVASLVNHQAYIIIR